MIDYDYAIDLDDSRQLSKPYPYTPDIWPRKKDNEKVDEDEAVEDEEGNRTLSAEEIQLQKEILEAYKRKVEKNIDMHGQRTVCLDLLIPV